MLFRDICPSEAGLSTRDEAKPPQHNPPTRTAG